MIYYDLEGNIKQSLFSVPDEFIGREFIFDEQRNLVVIKVVLKVILLLQVKHLQL